MLFCLSFNCLSVHSSRKAWFHFHVYSGRRRQLNSPAPATIFIFLCRPEGQHKKIIAGAPRLGPARTHTLGLWICRLALGLGLQQDLVPGFVWPKYLVCLGLGCDYLSFPPVLVPKPAKHPQENTTGCPKIGVFVDHLCISWLYGNIKMPFHMQGMWQVCLDVLSSLVLVHGVGYYWVLSGLFTVIISVAR